MTDWPQSDHDVLVRIATLVEVLRGDLQEIRATLSSKVTEQDQRIRALEDANLRLRSYAAAVIVLAAALSQGLRLALDAILR